MNNNEINEMQQSKIDSPKEFYGFKIGTDKKLARWDEIVEYFWHLDEQSNRVKVKELGKSTKGNPFLLTIISSQRNIENIDRLREVNLALAHPCDSDEDIDKLVQEGKAFVSNTMSVHGSEVGGTQTASELAYELATREDPETSKIRKNTVFLLIPSSNPDGNKMVVDWYEEWLDTEYEGVRLPYLYHKYVGHDNNRDAFHITQKESKLLTKFFYKDWYPQATIDHHQMGSFGARFNIPPHADPVYEHIDPLVWAEQKLYGGMMLLDLESAGKTGIETECSFSAEVSPTWEETPCLHGICGMLTESASANLATAKYIHRQQLNSGSRGRPEYRTQIVFPHPWEGGWWRLRDIVEQQKISSIAALKVAANHREKILRNMRKKANRQIRLGKTESPYGFIVSPDQHDPLTALQLLETLKAADVRIHKATEQFQVAGATYPKGTHVIFTSQVCRPLILKLLESTIYHDGPLTRKEDDTPIPPYDLATDNMAEFMNVKIVEASQPLPRDKFTTCDTLQYPQGNINNTTSEAGYLLDGRLNESFKLVNKLLAKDINVYRVEEPVKNLPVGAFYIPQQNKIETELKKLATEHYTTFHGVDRSDFEKHLIESLKIGMYRRYWGGNTDEGWTRWLLEEYGFNFDTMRDEDFETEDLYDYYDVIIIPNDPKCMIRGEDIEEYYQKTRPKYVLPEYPPEYQSGLDDDAIENLKTFVKEGGRLITFGQAAKFAIEDLDLPLNDPLEEIDSKKEFFCPGSTLKADIDTEHPLAYGIDPNTVILYGHAWKNYPVFDLQHTNNSDKYDIVVSFPKENMLQSGWLLGEKHLRNKAAFVQAKIEEGDIILSAFQPQFRAQTAGTFKLLFNALFH